MRVYKLSSVEEYELCRPEDPRSFDSLIADQRPAINWTPSPVRILHWDEGRKLERSDVPWWGRHVLIFRKTAADKLSAYLEEYGQLLPLECEETELVAFKVGRYLKGALSNESEMERFDDGSPSIVWKYIFDPGVVGGIDVFKLPEFSVSAIFVGDGFVKAWRRSGLVGLGFEKVWEETDRARA